jgi:uncharacterized membrane protein (Fun14 family)
MADVSIVPTLSSALAPISYQLGVGGIGGFLVGYALKKIGKLIAVLGGLVVLLVLYLGNKGIVIVNYDKLSGLVSSLLPILNEGPQFVSGLVSNLPFAGSFMAGFALGIKVG